MSFARLAVTSSVWRTLGVAVNSLVTLSSMVIWARLLTPSDFGVVAAAQIVTGLALMFADFGIAPALIQRKEISKNHISVAFAFTVLLGQIVFWSVFALVPLFAAFLKDPAITDIVRGLSIAFPVTSLSIVSDAMLRRELRFGSLFWIESVASVLAYLGVGTALAILGYGAWSIVAASLSYAAIKTIALLSYAPYVFWPRLHWQELRELASFGGGYSLLRFVNYWTQKVDNLIIGRFGGPVALGLYDRSFELVTKPGTLIGSVLDSVLFPLLSRAQDNRARMQRAFWATQDLTMVIMSPVSVMMLVLSPEIVVVILGNQWTEITPVLQVLALVAPFRTSIRIGDSVARSMGALGRNTLLKLAYLLSTVVGTLVGLRWSLTGVAIGVGVSVVLHYVAMMLLSSSLLQTRASQFIPSLRLSLAVTGLSILLSFPLASVLRSWSLPPVVVLVTVVASTLTGLGTLYLFQPQFFGSGIARLVEQVPGLTGAKVKSR